MLYHSCTSSDGIFYYCVGTSQSHTAQNCNKLEQVQRRAARFACCKYERTAIARDIRAEWLEMGSHWRPDATACRGWPCFTVYATQHGVYHSSWLAYLVPVQPSRSRRSGHDQMYQVPYVRTDVFKRSFFPATVRMWNSLPVTVIQSHSIQSFKAGISALRQHWLTWP